MPNALFLDARILLVDDQEPNLLLLKKMLGAQGYVDLTAVSDPREVVPLHTAAPFDLILLDLSMPHMDGFAVMAALKEARPGVALPVLVLTAQTDYESRIRALDLGARDFLTKPFDRLEVLARIRNHLEVQVLHRQLREHNLLLEDKVRARTQDLHDSQLEIVRRLSRAAEYRDYETGLHVVRMSQYAAALGRAIGLPRAEWERIQDAAPMHDVGKIGIPDRFLHKPAKLDPEVWAIMQTHAQIGADLLDGHPAPLLQCAAEIALSHHEKWDGQGYPRALAGLAIPLTGRIVAVADVFDALTTARPYKSPWTPAAAFAFIAEQAGRHFDPRLAEAFQGIAAEVLEIRERYAEPYPST